MIDRLRTSSMLALALAAGCATTPARPAEQARRAADYSPLPLGAAWTYDVEYPGQKGEMTVTLVGQKDGYFFDDHKGAFRHTKDGLRDRERFLIRHPVEVGNEWSSVTGASAVERMRITSVGQTCEAAAGRFEDCVVVAGSLRRDKTMTLHIQWTWAREVGLVKLSTEAEVEGKGRLPQVKQSLKHYSFAATSKDPARAAPADAGGKSADKAAQDDGPNNWVSE